MKRYLVPVFLLVLCMTGGATSSCIQHIENVKFCSGGDQVELRLASGDPVHCNQLVPTTTVSDQPGVKYAAAEQGKYYTVLMVDPDAPHPENPTQRYYLHWLLTDVKGEDLATGGRQLGGVPVAEYAGPSPPPGSEHRYQFLVFEQREKWDGPTSITKRGKFNVDTLAEENNLCLKATTQFKSERSRQ